MIDTPVPEQIRQLIATLKDQREEAKDAIVEAQARIEEIDETLPELEAILERHAAPAGPQIDTATAAAAVALPAGLVQLKRLEDVQREVAQTAEELPARCIQSDIESALARRGFEVNPGTLRKNLTDMARVGNTFSIAEQGRGRRATVFEKVTGGEYRQ